MSAPDFARIRREVNLLHPSSSAALDRAFTLMKRHQLETGGDSHHGCPKKLFPKFDFRESPSNEWNRVRIPRDIHVRVHVLLAAAFDGTPYFLTFLGAKILLHAPTVGPLEVKKQRFKNRIIAWYKSGKSIHWVADKLGVSGSSISAWLHSWGIETRTAGETRVGIRKAQFKNRIIAWYESGKSSDWIGDKLGYDGGTIRKWLNDWDVQIRSIGEAHSLARIGKKKDKFKDRVVVWYESGKSAAWIGNKIGVSDGTVRRWLDDCGVQIRSLNEAHSLAKTGKKKERFKDRIVAWYKSRKSTTWIADKVGVGDGSISVWLREWDVPIRNRSDRATGPRGWAFNQIDTSNRT